MKHVVQTILGFLQKFVWWRKKPELPKPSTRDQIVGWLETLSDEEIEHLIVKLCPWSLMRTVKPIPDLELNFGYKITTPVHWWTGENKK